MEQKILKIGSSAGVTLSPQALKALGREVGDSVRVKVDEDAGEITFSRTESISANEQKILRLGLDFINRYRKDFEQLADK